MSTGATSSNQIVSVLYHLSSSQTRLGYNFKIKQSMPLINYLPPMRKLLTSKHLLPFQTRAQPAAGPFRPDALFSLLSPRSAATPKLPPQLKRPGKLMPQQTSTMLSGDAVYGENFSHADGLSRQNMERALTQLWQRYPQLKYQTAILETRECDRRRDGY